MPTFRSLTDQGNAAAANITGSEPAGAAADDILIASLYIESTTTITPPAGWSDSFNGTTMVGEVSSAGVFKQYLYWIRRGGSAPALQWLFSSAYRELVIAAYSGARASGDPFSFGDIELRDNAINAIWPDTSGVTSDANETLVWVGTNIAGGAASDQPTGFTERQDINATDTAWADKAQAAAGATGTVTGAQVTSGSTNGPHVSMLVGLRPTAAAGGDLDVLIGEPPCGSSALN